jgi:hypothetical protein
MHRPPRGGVPANYALLMLGEACVKIVGMPGVVRSIVAPQKVGVELHCHDLPWARILRQAQDERGLYICSSFSA